MYRSRVTFSWLMSVTALVTMIAVEWLHSPLHHLTGCHGAHCTVSHCTGLHRTSSNGPSSQDSESQGCGSHCSGESSCPALVCSTNEQGQNETDRHDTVAAACGHAHHHHAHSPLAEGNACEEDAGAGQVAVAQHEPAPPVPAEHSDDHEHCHLCQFLTQAIQPLSCPVVLIGTERVAEIPESELPAARALSLPGPYVRGPPLSV